MSTNNRNATKNGLVSRAQQLSAGVAKRLTNQPQVTFTGGPFTPAQITSKLQSIVTLRSDVVSAQTVLHAKVATERASAPALRAFVDAFVAYLRSTFGDQPEVLGDFGLTPRKAAAPRPVEQKAAAAAKRAATRKARGTVGPKAKKAVKGNVVGIAVTPVTATITPAAPEPTGTTVPVEPTPTAPSAAAPPNHTAS